MHQMSRTPSTSVAAVLALQMHEPRVMVTLPSDGPVLAVKLLIPAARGASQHGLLLVLRFHPVHPERPHMDPLGGRPLGAAQHWTAGVQGVLVAVLPIWLKVPEQQRIALFWFD
eukprot:CAMPEP_0177758204 /NCGR_PEP_ID=MMETSP0491_2-20121128/4060_1 /TAXON_ID=63592 /ORGANISM="Tetraselmis chuii, Strain PLY429" /LENGTH=113 /DNA_ID=CAMNT_0019273923 /DNA_START=150 /DNA_END=492 /DNA_ORIENTATION=-